MLGFAEKLEQGGDPKICFDAYLRELKESPTVRWSIYSQLKWFEDLNQATAKTYLMDLVASVLVNHKEIPPPEDDNEPDWLTYGLCHVEKSENTFRYVLSEVSFRDFNPKCCRI